MFRCSCAPSEEDGSVQMLRVRGRPLDSVNGRSQSDSRRRRSGTHRSRQHQNNEINGRKKVHQFSAVHATDAEGKEEQQTKGDKTRGVLAGVRRDNLTSAKTSENTLRAGDENNTTENTTAELKLELLHACEPVVQAWMRRAQGNTMSAVTYVFQA